MKAIEKNEGYYRASRVLWIVKSGDKLYGKVLGTYPYTVEVDLKNGEGICTCPKGGNCKHVEAVMKAYEFGFYTEASNISWANAETVAWSFLLKNPERALEVSLKELINSLSRDESGSETATHFLKTAELIKRSGKVEFIHPLEDAFEEFRATFSDYPLTKILEKRLNTLKESFKKAL